MRVLAGLALAGLRHRVGLWLLLALGVALAAGLPVFAAGLRADGAVAAVRTAVDEIPPASRAVLSVTSTTLDGAELRTVDRTMRDGYTSLGLADVRQTMTFRPLAVGGSQFALAAVDDLPAAVRLDSGRWPTSCTPTACEVVAVALSTTDTVPASAQPAIRSQLGVTVTGTATLLDDRLLGVRLLAPDVPLLLGGDPTALAASKPLALFGRATGWIGTLDGSSVAARGADVFAHELAQLTEQVNAAVGPLTTTWPDESVLAAAARAAASADRFTVLGVGAGVLQLGFCLVVAAGLRRRQQLVGRLLERRGAGRGQLTAVAIWQTVPMVLAGLLAGAVVAGAVVATMGRTLPAGAWSSARSALADTAPTLVWLALAAVVTTVAAVRWPDSAATRTVLVLDVATVLALGLVVLVLVDPPSGSTGMLSTLTIVSAASVTGLVAARGWQPAMLLAGRLIPSRHPLQHMVVGARCWFSRAWRSRPCRRMEISRGCTVGRRVRSHPEFAAA